MLTGRMKHELQLVEGFPERELPQIAALASSTGGFDEAALRAHLEGRKAIVTCVARSGGALAGYKIGYQDRPFYFESWIGAVAPEFRRQGTAAALMELQHQWCREHGFRIVSTITEGNNRPMLIANLKAGFEICGTFLDRRKVLKVVLQKHLE